LRSQIVDHNVDFFGPACVGVRNHNVDLNVDLLVLWEGECERTPCTPLATGLLNVVKCLNMVKWTLISVTNT
jgi:hypothetical protein